MTAFRIESVATKKRKVRASRVRSQRIVSAAPPMLHSTQFGVLGFGGVARHSRRLELIEQRRAISTDVLDLLFLFAEPVDTEAHRVAALQEYRIGFDARPDSRRRAGR